jgi:hypothetical protein
MALIVNNVVFCDFTAWGFCKNRVFLRSVRRLLVTANVIPSSPILVTLMMEALRSSETSVLTGTRRCNTQEDGISSFDRFLSHIVIHSLHRATVASCC